MLNKEKENVYLWFTAVKINRFISYRMAGMGTGFFTKAGVTGLLIALFACSVQAAELRISVAASMADVFRELIGAYSKDNPGVTIRPNFGPSGGLARQITLGAPADLYVSANPKWMRSLIDEGRVVPESAVTLVYNSLVFIGLPNKDISSLEGLIGLGRIALGSPGSVPAGQYAKQAMTKAGLYEKLFTGGKLVMAKDVRQALIYADRGEVDGAFVYRTDALLAKQATILFEVPQDLYDRVTCPAALTVEGAGRQEARDLFAYVTSDAAGRVIERYGFTLPRKKQASIR